MIVTVFFSWQSDTAAETGQEFVTRALGLAIHAIHEDPTFRYRPRLDQDTRGVPGAPPIVQTILAKIDACSVFVADVSLTFQRQENKRLSPNPNVLIELGYALRRLGTERILLIMDSATGRPEDLPFDLRGHRVVLYHSARGNDGHADLMARFEDHLRHILTSCGPPPDTLGAGFVELEVVKVHLVEHRHEYRLMVIVNNRGRDLFQDWYVEVRFPNELLNPNRAHPIARESKDAEGRATMRQDHKRRGSPIFPGDRKEVLSIDYVMDRGMAPDRSRLLSMNVDAALFVRGLLVDSVRRTIASMQVMF